MGKRIAVLSDFHAGARTGLTVPGYLPDEPAERNAEWVNVNRACWRWFDQKIRETGPFDLIFVNGDLIDGRGSRSGGSEQITADLEEQADMAIAAIRKVPKRKGCKIAAVRGTGYHVSPDGEDWENIIASAVGATIADQLWLDVEGVVFDLKHQPAGNSNIPHGRHTGIAKDRLWNVLWAMTDGQPKADVFVRSHVHHHHFAGGPDWLAMTTPALQAVGTKYGNRRCVGVVDFGFVTFEVNKGTYTWQAHIARIAEQKAKLIKL